LCAEPVRGSVDVALVKDGCVRVACEISVTTPAEHEIENIQKCLAAGFDRVALVTADRKMMAKLTDLLAAKLAPKERELVRIGAVEDFVAFVEELETGEASTEQTVRG